MSATDIKDLYEKNILGEDEMNKLAQIKADLLAAASKDGKEIIKVISEHLKQASFTQGDYEDAAKYLDGLEAELEKVARDPLPLPKGTFGKILGYAGPILGAGMLLALGAEKGIGALVSKSQLKSSLDQVKLQHPELRKDPMTDQHFQAIATFSPSIAKNPVVASSLLLKMKQWGAIDHKTIQDLISMEKSLGEQRRPGLGIPEAVRTMAGLQGLVTGEPLTFAM